MRQVRWLLAVWVLSMSPVPGLEAQVPSLDGDDPQAAFHLMAEYLSRDGGRWRGANPNHDASNGRSPAEFGLWFRSVLEGHVLELSIVLHYADSVVVSSAGSWVWHPGAGELRYQMVGRNGSLTEGTTEFPDPRTFTTLATLLLPDGRTSEHRDDNVLVDGNLHRNETFQRDPSGDWVSRGIYDWHRESG